MTLGGIGLIFRLASLALCLAASVEAQRPKLKVLISVDMEGITGVTTTQDTSPSGHDYEYFRRVMTKEANAAIEGAFDAGATEVVVRDGHGGKTNLLPEELDTRAVLVRGNDQGPRNMMFPVDRTFDAVVFIGYHAKAGTKDAILAHTSNSNVADFSINGVSLPEGGYNALVAGLYGVPVVFVAGDQAACDQIKALVGDIESVAVKSASGQASINLHPDVAREKIRFGVRAGVRKRAEYKVWKLSPPYRMKLVVKKERTAADELYAGSRRVRPGEFEFESEDLLKVLDAFNQLK